jgi:hypothetical protein
MRQLAQVLATEDKTRFRIVQVQCEDSEDYKMRITIGAFSSGDKVGGGFHKKSGPRSNYGQWEY